ncbi:MAG: leucine-rich repeat domain-containing protein [Lachnospiraceae bacterium]|nr:leucine-rich repeat domain-containing protein [Lachnospiraceae bacterium]
MKVRKGPGKFKWSVLALFVTAMLLAMVENADIASAEETSDVVTLDGIEYMLDEETKTATVSEYSNKTSTECKEIVIPTVILYGENKYTVTTIGNGSFSQASYLEKITIPSTVKVIEAGAFLQCSALKEVNLPVGLEKINASTFLECSSLESIVIPDTVTYIDDAAFLGCSKLKKIVIPDTVTYIGHSSFQLCTSLEEMVLPKNLEETGTGVFIQCSSLKKVVFPDGLQSVENYFFAECTALEQVVFPECVSDVAWDCIGDCTNLKSIYYPSGLSTPEFTGILENLIKISYATNDDGTVSLTVEKLPEGVTNIELPSDIGGKVISSITGLSESDIPVSCMKHYHTSYGKDTKEHWYTCEVCKKEVRAVHSFGTGLQTCECGYVPFTITVQPSDLRLSYGYKNGSISVTVKKTLGNESVSYQWYKDGKAISGATSGTCAIPTGSSVGKYAYTCKISSGGYLAITASATVTVNAPAKGSKYKDDKKMATYKITKAGTGGRGTVEYVKPVNKKKKSVTIPATVKIGGVTYKVTSIAKSAFYKCTKLKTLKFGSNITTIGDKAFYKCTALTKVSLPAKVKTVGKQAFYGCKKITSVTLGKSVSKVGSKAFYGCNKLKTLTIKSTKLTTKKVGSSAFAKTPKSMTVKVPKKKFKAYKAMLFKKGVYSAVKFRKI